MKQLFILMMLSLPPLINAQTAKSLTLEQCQLAAEQNYPLTQKRDLIAQSRAFTLENISKGYLPQLSANGQMTYQSDVTEIPVSIPGIDMPTQENLQYKAYAEMTQLLYDGGKIKQLKNSENAKRNVETQKLEVGLYELRERIINLYFGILINNEQQKQNGLLKNDLQIGLKSVEAQIANGTAFRSNADLLKAELLKVEQNAIALRSNKKAYLQMLGLFIGEELPENTELQKPQTPLVSSAINRPELAMFNFQTESFELEKKLITSDSRPKLNFFVQAGMGNPGLNMFEEGVQDFYIGGLRMTWNLTHTKKKQKAILDLNKLSTASDKETFLFNTNQSLQLQNAEINKLQEYLKVDGEIIALRSNVKKAALAQLQNGVIDSSDYLREVNEENQARQNKSTHETELLLAQYREKITRGN
ncbi:TolC family protein [Flavobacterium sp.]|uniref:TolC family protein n=1 Tax=Flavobacterium sp. TaxID=239 RepID=UPI0039E65E5B